MSLPEFTDGLSVLSPPLPPKGPRSARPPGGCAAPEGQPEVGAEGCFPELPGGLCAPWTVVMSTRCRGLRAVPQGAASALGGGQPLGCTRRARADGHSLHGEVCSAPWYTWPLSMRFCSYRCCSFLLWVARPLGFLYRPLSFVH